MNGKEFIDALFYDIGKYQVLITDTNLRVIALSWLNRIKNEISSRHEHWTWLEQTAIFNTVASQMTYDLPTDIDLSGNKVMDLRQKTSPAKLIYISQKRLDELDPNPTRTGNPTHWTKWANQIRLYPIPSSVITMYLRYMLDKATDYNDEIVTSQIPVKFDWVVNAGMKKYAFAMFPRWGNVAEANSLFENGIGNMLSDNNIVLDDDQLSEGRNTHNRISEPYSFNNEDVG
jgi:hypothetical protein